VQIESTEKVGTSVTIWLPIAAAVAAEEDVAPAYDDDPHKLGSRVMVLDDDDGVRSFIAECLDMLGYVPIEVSSGAEALARIADSKPELLIVDFAMPGMNGLEVARAAHQLAPGMPILLATGYAEIDYKSGDDVLCGTLRKPFQIADLARTIHNVMAELAPT
jgi:CheY-like chemotaxis protein